MQKGNAERKIFMLKKIKSFKKQLKQFFALFLFAIIIVSNVPEVLPEGNYDTGCSVCGDDDDEFPSKKNPITTA